MGLGFYLLAAVLLLGPLIALHEWGHFWVARKLGIKVLTYSIGFGPALYKKVGKDGVSYQLSAIPLGGYVRMLDEREGEVQEAEKHLAFNNQKPWKKIAVVAAGPIMNLLIAIVLFWILLIPKADVITTKVGSIVKNSPADKAGLMVGDTITHIDDKVTSSWNRIRLRLLFHLGDDASIPIKIERNGKNLTKEMPVTNFLNQHDRDFFKQVGFEPQLPNIPAKIGKVIKDGAAYHQGMLVGDEIIKINDQPISNWFEMHEMISKNPEKAVSIVVLRKKEEVLLTVMPQGVKVKQKEEPLGRIGVMPDKQSISYPANYKTSINRSVMDAFSESLLQTKDISLLSLNSFGKLLLGKVSIENLSGPISIAQGAGESLSIGWRQFFSFMALISISLAILNLLPIPVLDGGHILYYTYELIIGKPLPEKVQLAGMQIGMVLMLIFMAVAITNDINRVF